MFVIEHILLRTDGFNPPYLRVCADPTCEDCSEDDPYSYRLHVILPAENGRFTNMDFRRFVEEVIREEVPAHVMPKVCWVDKDTLVQVEKAYRYWLSARAAGGGVPELEALIKVLDAIRSVYPPGWLHACEPGESTEKPKFQIGRTRLGSQGT